MRAIETWALRLRAVVALSAVSRAASAGCLRDDDKALPETRLVDTEHAPTSNVAATSEGEMITFGTPDHTVFETSETTIIVQAESSRAFVRSLKEVLTSSEDVFRRVAQAVVEGGFDVPPFVCLRRDGPFLHLFLVGEVSARVAGPEGLVLNGTSTSTWTEHTVPADSDVTISWAGADVQATEPENSDARPTPGSLQPPPGPDLPGVGPTASAPTPDDSTAVTSQTPVPPSPPKPPGPPAPPAPFNPAANRSDTRSPRSTKHLTNPASPAEPDSNLIRADATGINGVSPLQPQADLTHPIVEPAATESQLPENAPNEDVTLDADVVRQSIAEDPPAPGASSRPLVTARVCPCGGASPLGAEDCGVCGSSLRREGVMISQVERPSIGNLVLDDGTVLPLNDSFVVGRNVPETLEVDGRILPGISVDSPTKQVSKVHLEVRLVDWTANIVDLDSANGTYIEDAAGHPPRRLRPRVVEQLTPGDSVLFGDRTFTFENATDP